MSKSIKLIVNGIPMEVQPTLHRTLLEFIREDCTLAGTKEGCNEGDCGACTIVAFQNGRFEAINACIRMLITCDGLNLFTVEYLEQAGALHPVQQAFVAHHASQCGFCTPGFIMSLYCLWLNEDDADLARINEAIAGNLCRCTGYYPIQQAALALMKIPRVRPPIVPLEKNTIAHEGYYAPRTIGELAQRYSAAPESLLVAGQTDIGLWINKHNIRPNPMISLHNIDELKVISYVDNSVHIGAMVSNTAVKKLFATLHPSMDELMRRFGGEQVRNSGTIGGNIGNASPIGDLPPLLIALNAQLQLRCGHEARCIDIESYFLDYKKQDRRAGEFIEKIILPKPKPQNLLHISKISKRFDEDISTLLGVFHLRLEAGIIHEVRIAFGGMAGIPKRGHHAEAAMRGKAWNTATIAAAQRALNNDFTPLSDHRASGAYRMMVAQNLLTRFYEESQPAHKMQGGGA